MNDHNCNIQSWPEELKPMSRRYRQGLCGPSSPRMSFWTVHDGIEVDPWHYFLLEGREFFGHDCTKATLSTCTVGITHNKFA